MERILAATWTAAAPRLRTTRAWLASEAARIIDSRSEAALSREARLTGKAGVAVHTGLAHLDRLAVLAGHSLLALLPGDAHSRGGGVRIIVNEFPLVVRFSIVIELYPLSPYGAGHPP